MPCLRQTKDLAMLCRMINSEDLRSSLPHTIPEAIEANRYMQMGNDSSIRCLYVATIFIERISKSIDHRSQPRIQPRCFETLIADLTSIRPVHNVAAC